MLRPLKTKKCITIHFFSLQKLHYVIIQFRMLIFELEEQYLKTASFYNNVIKHFEKTVLSPSETSDLTASLLCNK